VFFVERVRPLQMLLAEKTRVRPLENRRPRAASQQIAAPVAQKARARQQHDHHCEIEFSRARDDADREQ